MSRPILAALALAALAPAGSSRAAEAPPAFFATFCGKCHAPPDPKGGLDLAGLLEAPPADPEALARWVKVHDRIESGEMPPKKSARPSPAQAAEARRWLRGKIVEAERVNSAGEGRTRLRRLTRVEYENTVRDLLDLPGLKFQELLPADGSAHGFDTNSDALDISHVNLASYVEAADLALGAAIVTRPDAPPVTRQRISLANPHGFVALVLLYGDAVMLKDKKPDPAFPPAGAQRHLDQFAHESLGMFDSESSVGLFRPEDESFHPSFIEFSAIDPGRYRLRTSLWSFQWDKGRVLPARGTEVGRLSIIHLTGNGTGGDHPNTVLGYYDAPSLQPKVHDVVTWLNPKDTIGFNAASLAPGRPPGARTAPWGSPGPGSPATISRSKALSTTSGRPGAIATSSETSAPPRSGPIRAPRLGPPTAPRLVRRSSRGRTGPVRSRASGRSRPRGRWRRPTASSARSSAGRSAGPSRPRPAGNTSHWSASA